jgi:hypothetical protein
MHGVPPHLLPQTPSPLQGHFRCYHCGFDNQGARSLRCPRCGHHARGSQIRRGGVAILVACLAGTLLLTWATYRLCWNRSDYVLERERIFAGAPVPPVVLRDFCRKECAIRALVVCLLALAGCLVYSYCVFEPARTRHWRRSFIESITGSSSDAADRR